MAKGKHSGNGRDSSGKRLGIKTYGGQRIKSGSIIIKQRGTKFYPGFNVGIGKDFSLFAKIDGVVKFEYTPGGKQKVSVYPV